MIDEVFARRVSETSNNLTGLINIRDYLDESKRKLRDTIAKENRVKPTSNSEYKLDDLNERLEELIAKGNYIREKIRIFKAEQKLLNSTMSKNPTFVQAFMVAAEQILDEDTFLEVEAKAQVLMTYSEV